MSAQGRRTAAVATGLLLACFVILVAASMSGGGDAAAGRSETDGAFIAGMVPHHSAAVEMAQIALDRSKRREVKRLAQDVVDSQIEEMGLLRASHQRLFGAPLSSTSGDHRAMSDRSRQAGMTPAELAKTPEFDRAFLDAMVPHHQAAISMAKRELAKGRDPELRKIARRIVAAQSREIGNMRIWRARWYGGR